MSTQIEEEPTVEQLADALADKLDVDIILYNGPIIRPIDTLFIEKCINRDRRTNVLLILVTQGGDADAAYRIARCLQDNYEEFSLYVTGYCKSAGTLIATGAHELIISDYGELGPLDVQMSKEDELWQTQSGLIVMDTLSALQDNAFMAFESFFLQIKAKSDDAITLRTATEIATEVTTGLFSSLYERVDPMHVGEARRAMSIASDYGKRLLLRGGNIDEEALGAITSEYASHGFVIDRSEARRLFRQVRKPSQDESLLAEELGQMSLVPRNPNPMQITEFNIFEFLSTERYIQENEEDDIERENDAKPAGPEGTEPSDFVEETPAQPIQALGQENFATELNGREDGSNANNYA